MSTLKQAMDSGEVRVTIAGRLVCKQIYHTGHQALLKMLLHDRDGNSVEAKCWWKHKNYTVFSHFEVGQCVHLSVNRETLRQPDQKFTQAKYETLRSWYLIAVDDDEFIPKNHFHCWTSVRKYCESRRRPAASILGLFQSMTEGPSKYWRGRQVLQGYYVTLLDDEGTLFVALVWKSLQRNSAYRFDLDHCKQSDRVLIINAREQDEKYRARSPRHFIVTTTYPPIVNSNSVSPAARRSISQGPRIMEISDRPYEAFCGLVMCA